MFLCLLIKLECADLLRSLSSDSFYVHDQIWIQNAKEFWHASRRVASPFQWVDSRSARNLRSMVVHFVVALWLQWGRGREVCNGEIGSKSQSITFQPSFKLPPEKGGVLVLGSCSHDQLKVLDPWYIPLLLKGWFTIASSPGPPSFEKRVTLKAGRAWGWG